MGGDCDGYGGPATAKEANQKAALAPIGRAGNTAAGKPRPPPVKGGQWGHKQRAQHRLRGTWEGTLAPAFKPLPPDRR